MVSTGFAPARSFEHRPLKTACLLFHHETRSTYTLVAARLPRLGHGSYLQSPRVDQSSPVGATPLALISGSRIRTDVLKGYEPCELLLLYSAMTRVGFAPTTFTYST